jgi:threonine dehydrogenase-like Zn-dependent dehydrogenase
VSAALPAVQRAVVFTARDQVIVEPAKPVPPLGPTQLMLEMEACGICFSDTKLLHAFAAHPRKSPITAGLSAAELAEIPTYAPGELPLTPGHEPVGRIVAVGSAVQHHRVGERVLVQTDYRHLPTAASYAAFGYTFDGGLAEYALVDERMVVDPATGARYLIPVDEQLSASAVALIEPWACVEEAYAWPERQGLRPGGDLLVVCEPGHSARGLAAAAAAAQPRRVVVVGTPPAEWPAAGQPFEAAADLAAVTGAFDDIVYAGADPATLAALGPRLKAAGLLAIVTGGARFGAPSAVDVGRVHYDLIRYAGTTTDDLQAAYARIPATTELRAGDRLAVIGAAGPMGLMHAVRAATSGIAGLSLDAVDVDEARLARLAEVLGPTAAARGVPTRIWNSAAEPLPEQSYEYVALMVPAASLVEQAVALAADGAIVNAFAGFAVGTVAHLDFDAVVERGLYLVGTSGSRIEDMATVLARVQAGLVDTNVSMGAVTGLDGVPDAIAAVANRAIQGKIMVYPKLAGLGLVRLSELPTRLPAVAAAMDGGRWTKAAEDVLLATA